LEVERLRRENASQLKTIHLLENNNNNNHQYHLNSPSYDQLGDDHHQYNDNNHINGLQDDHEMVDGKMVDETDYDDMVNGEMVEWGSSQQQEEEEAPSSHHNLLSHTNHHHLPLTNSSSSSLDILNLKSTLTHLMTKIDKYDQQKKKQKKEEEEEFINTTTTDYDENKSIPFLSEQHALTNNDHIERRNIKKQTGLREIDA